jgi:hypothetical protein
MLTRWNILLGISGICQYSTYSMPCNIHTGDDINRAVVVRSTLTIILDRHYEGLAYEQ